MEWFTQPKVLPQVVILDKESHNNGPPKLVVTSIWPSHSDAEFDGDLDSAIDHCLIADILYETKPRSDKLLPKVVFFAKATLKQ
mmetsp:Transcript_9994/g.21641  ORF Transcript_9994/g.21641 Transcript_9994/m.21641 type:complete len:84 (-) Transcript_9994:1102-1353(-)